MWKHELIYVYIMGHKNLLDFILKRQKKYQSNIILYTITIYYTDPYYILIAIMCYDYTSTIIKISFQI